MGRRKSDSWLPWVLGTQILMLLILYGLTIHQISKMAALQERGEKTITQIGKAMSSFLEFLSIIEKEGERKSNGIWEGS